MFFSVEIFCMIDVFEGKSEWFCKQLTKIGGIIVLRSRPRAAIFVVSFAGLKSHALSRVPSGDRMMPRAEIKWRNITVMSHLKFRNSSCRSSLSYQQPKLKKMSKACKWLCLGHLKSPELTSSSNRSGVLSLTEGWLHLGCQHFLSSSYIVAHCNPIY